MEVTDMTHEGYPIYGYRLQPWVSQDSLVHKVTEAWVSENFITNLLTLINIDYKSLQIYH